MTLDFLNNFTRPSVTNGYEDLAVQYISHFVKNPTRYSKLNRLSQQSSGVSVAASGYSSMSYIAKRSVALWDHTVITHQSGIFIPVESKEFGGESSKISISVDFHHLYELGKWIYDVRELINNDSLLFVPRIRVSRVPDEPDYPNVGDYGIQIETEEPLIDAVLDCKIVSQLRTRDIVKSRYFFPIITVDLPGVDNADLKTFSRIVSEQTQSVKALRILLREHFLDIAGSEGSEKYFADLERIGLEIKKGVTSLGVDLRSEAKKHAFQISGSVLTTVSATLLAVNVTALEYVGSIAASGGGMYLFLDAIKDILIAKDTKESRPYYYLWLLENKANPLK